MRQVPINLAAGWGGVDAGAPMLAGAPPSGAMRGGGGPVHAFAAPASISGEGTGLSNLLDQVLGSVSDSQSTDANRAQELLQPWFQLNSTATPAIGLVKQLLNHAVNRKSHDRASSPPPPAQTDPLLDLLSLQAADGSFGWNAGADQILLSFSGKSAHWQKAIAAALPASVKGDIRDAIIHTVMAVILLRRNFAHREALWKRAMRKAVKEYLGKALNLNAAEVETWLQKVKEVLK